MQLWPTLLPVKPDHQHSQAFIPNLYTQRNSARFSSDYRPACDSAVFCNYGNNLSVVKSNKVTERARIWSGVCVQCRAETSRSRLNRHGSANSCRKETISASASATRPRLTKIKKDVRPERTARRQWSSEERPVTPCLSDIDSPARWQQTICLGGAAGGVIYRRRPTQRAAAAQWPPACPGRNSSSRLSTIAHSVRPSGLIMTKLTKRSAETESAPANRWPPPRCSKTSLPVAYA